VLLRDTREARAPKTLVRVLPWEALPQNAARRGPVGPGCRGGGAPRGRRTRAGATSWSARARHRGAVRLTCFI
jgi:hypothetical protein